MPKRFLIVEEDQEPEHPRDPRWEEIEEILDGALAQLIERNQGQCNLIEVLEARLIHLALEQAHRNQSRAARQLGMPRKRLERRVRKYNQRRIEP